MERKQVIIVGGGFGGLNAAKKLGRAKEVSVTLVDRRNYHLFQPLLYQVATAGLSPAEIAVPIRAELSDFSNTRVILGNVTDIDKENKKIAIDGELLPFDFLILACGAKHSYFGHVEWEELAPGLKTLEQATEIRRRILLSYELAETEKNLEKQKALLTFIIVGGGPTGVELAGAIAEISRFTLEKDFRYIDPSRTRVILIEAGPRILSAFDAELAKQATRDLESLGVQVWTNTRVTKVTPEGVYLQDEFIKCNTVLWAAGVEPSSLGKKLKTPLDKMGRVTIEPTLNIPGHENVYVIGDMAHFPFENGGSLPGLAPVAIQQGQHVAKNILLKIRGRTQLPFRYIDKGSMATIGKSKAILQFGKFKATGFIAWAAWLFVHIFYLVGFKNKFFVFIQWAWNYITFKKGARLIVAKEWKSTSPSK
ncbi:MAG: NAD(P)/FAD-dependent oxidoreductase [Bdellovibrionales bacterium]